MMRITSHNSYPYFSYSDLEFVKNTFEEKFLASDNEAKKMTQEVERASKYIDDLKSQIAKYRSDMDAMQMRTVADADKTSSLSQSLATATRDLADMTYKFDSLAVCFISLFFL